MVNSMLVVCFQNSSYKVFTYFVREKRITGNIYTYLAFLIALTQIYYHYLLFILDEVSRYQPTPLMITTVKIVETLKDYAII